MNTRIAFPWATITGLIATLLLSACTTMPSKQPSERETAPTTLFSPTLEPFTLATITPVVESIATELTANTGIEVIYLPSSRYSIKRIPGWLKKQDPHTFPEVDAIAGIASVWTELDAYPSFRLQNIQVVPIDLAHALVPGGERVVLSQDETNSSPRYFWLNPANALIMTGILSRDLTALINQMPYSENTKAQQITTLNRNQARINQTLRAFQVALDQALMDQAIMQVTTDKPELTGLLAATLLPDVSLEEANTSDLPTLLITSRKAHHKRYASLPKHIKVWSIDDFGKTQDNTFTERWNQSLNALIR